MISEKVNIETDGKKSIFITNDAGTFQVISEYDEKETLTSLSIYEFDKNSPLSSLHYNSKGELITKHVFTYNELGFVVAETKYDSNDNVIFYSSYELDSQGKRLHAKHSNGKEVVYNEEFKWNNNKLVSTLYRDNNGNLIDKEKVLALYRYQVLHCA